MAIPIQWTRWYQLYRHRLHVSQDTPPDISNESKFLCEWHDFFMVLMSMSGSWTIVVITIFRVISVGFPHKAKIWCTRRNAYIAILFCVFFLVCICIPIPFTVWSFETFDYSYYAYDYNIYNYNNNFYGDFSNTLTFCTYTNTIYTKIVMWIGNIIQVFLPFLIILFGNLFIIKHLYASRKMRNSMVQSQHANDSKSELSMSAILIAISFVFLITMMPYFAIVVVGQAFIEVDRRSLEYRKVFYLVQDLLFFVHYLNNVVNIVCYGLVGGTFKDELKGLFGMRKKSPTILSHATATTGV